MREGGGRGKTEAICLTSSGTLFLEAQLCPHAANGAQLGAQLQEKSSRKAEQSDAPHWAHPTKTS